MDDLVFSTFNTFQSIRGDGENELVANENDMILKLEKNYSLHWIQTPLKYQINASLTKFKTNAHQYNFIIPKT